MAFRSKVELDGDIYAAEVIDSYKPFIKGAYKRFVSRHHRVIGADPITDELQHIHTTINETIDASVFQRWRKRDDYRPPSIQSWAEKRSLDPTAIRGSVSVDGTVLCEPEDVTP